MRISDWSSDVCSSDLPAYCASQISPKATTMPMMAAIADRKSVLVIIPAPSQTLLCEHLSAGRGRWLQAFSMTLRSEEHTSELQSLMRISYAVFCLKKKNIHINRQSKKTKTQHMMI